MTSEDPKKAAKDAAENVAGKADSAVSSARTTAESTRDNVRELAGRATDAASELYGDARDRVRDTANRMPDASEAIAAGRQAYARGSQDVGRRVAKQPLEALLLAGAIGYLVGWATNRS